MTAVVPLYWVSSSVMAQLTQVLDSALQSWAAAWGVTLPLSGAVRLADSRELGDASPSGAGWDSMTAESGPWLRISGGLKDELAALMLGTDAARSKIAEEVAARALRALEDALHALLRSDVAASMADHPESLPAGAHWGVHYTATLGDKHLVDVLLRSATLEAHGWLRRPAPQALKSDSTEAALSHLPVSFCVELGHVEVSVGDLANLSAGDVILMPQLATEPLPVKVTGTPVELRAHLGSSKAQRAIQFVSASKRPTA
jgi:flagellar motor switch/type III secretory pathway protein FliN